MQSNYYSISEYPTGTPSPDVFVLNQQELPALQDGEVRIRNHWLSVDPYMRGRMSGVKTYIDPFALDAPLEGAAVGEIIESRDDRFKVGDRVTHMGGWRDVAQLSADTVTALPDLDVPEQAYLGVLGMPGMTALDRPQCDCAYAGRRQRPGQRSQRRRGLTGGTTGQGQGRHRCRTCRQPEETRLARVPGHCRG